MKEEGGRRTEKRRKDKVEKELKLTKEEVREIQGHLREAQQKAMEATGDQDQLIPAHTKQNGGWRCPTGPNISCHSVP